MKLEDAFEFVKTQREATDPNDGFMEQLRKFESTAFHFEQEAAQESSLLLSGGARPVASLHATNEMGDGVGDVKRVKSMQAFPSLSMNTMAKSEPVAHKHFNSASEKDSQAPTEETKPDLNDTGSDIFNLINNHESPIPMHPIKEESA